MMKKTAKMPKEKRRNSEKRKEKSRDAARCRRSRESEIFTDLAKSLPLSQSAISQLDKASVMRLVISYLKVHNLSSILPDCNKSTSADEVNDPLYIKALEGFLLVVSTEGDLVYLSENVNEYLGITQVDLMGNSIYEFCHPCDHDEIKEVLSWKSGDKKTSLTPRSFFIRLKCTLTIKGRNVNLKSATYKVIHCTGHMVSNDYSKDVKLQLQQQQQQQQKYLIAIGEPIPHPSNIEIPLDKQTFLSKHTLDMKFTYADEKMAEFLGYNPDDLIGKSLYNFYHAMDSHAVDKGFKTLFSKGQCETDCYRFLAKKGGYAWVLTQATLIYCSKGLKPNSVVCVNFIISGVEKPEEIYSCNQLNNVKNEIEEDRKIENNNNSLPQFVTAKILPPPVKHEDCEDSKKPANVAVNANNSRPQSVTARIFGQLQSRPQPATAKIFAPRTEEMNKGFLMFSDDEPGFTVLKDEPEDLTHLAPTPGDVCVPLDLPQFNDIFDDLLNENYCPLLTEEINSLSDSRSSCNSKTSGCDPFFSYRDDSESSSSNTDLNSRLLSPTIAKSPGGCSLPSLCSPNRSPILSDDDHMTRLVSLNMDAASAELDLDEDLSFKAPYIPLDEELPLLISTTDLMWGGAGSRSNDGWPPPAPQPTKSHSSLAELLLSETDSNSRTSVLKNDWESPKSMTSQSGEKVVDSKSSLRRSSGNNSNNKRPNTDTNDAGVGSKRTKSERRREETSSDRTPSQLLQHLMSGTNDNSKKKKGDESGWLSDSGGGSCGGGGERNTSKTVQNHSVLMNLLEKIPAEKLHVVADILSRLSRSSRKREDNMEVDSVGAERNVTKHPQQPRQQRFRLDSSCLLNPEGTAIPSLEDLSQQDYEVNAPIGDTSLLQGRELLYALDGTEGLCVLSP